ncbi:cellobiose 2-epimerase [Neptunitalea chrysea]|uniref:Cellobiose 2-epimerase n=1 Tax=Neptunitalea chrysea TaxID=1647581 RepID=A0A9W6B484_9FLAO|nr:AGE family epimerase/isomerase [Neptunitalea chrysea]GLB51300.1 cellobiose 2-epimerase [Neptunitalea chrysea]
MKINTLLIAVLITVSVQAQKVSKKLIDQFDNDAKEGLIDKWYPLALDKEDGGYYTDITYDFKLGDTKEKMIVTQARQVWVTSKAYKEYGDEKYLACAAHGYEFLKDVMWDKKHGGFHTWVNKQGKPIKKSYEAKTAYGNAFAIYALAAYYEVSHDEEVLELAKKTFMWLEEHSHDKTYKGYFQHMQIDGTPIVRTEDIPSTSDAGYKDQNSSIHLMEAFTELYNVWKDDLVKERLNELLLIIRDTIINDHYSMDLFFTPDWKPVSFRNESKEVINKHFYLDHVSFGHDVETAYLMLEASEAIGREDTEKTLEIGKRMVDHSLKTGLDTDKGGFYEGGYYFKGDKELTITNFEKNWWAQAEGLNTLLILTRMYPDDSMNYYSKFENLWKYTQKYMMDAKYGGWYSWGADVRPEVKKELKGHVWKTTYHNFRALINCKHQLEMLLKNE